MIKSVLLAHALTACICTTGGVLVAPKVKQAIHRVHPKPKVHHPRVARAIKPKTPKPMEVQLVTVPCLPVDLTDIDRVAPITSELIYTPPSMTQIINAPKPGLPYNTPALPFTFPSPVITPNTAVPETPTWLSMIIGFGLVGGAARRTGRAGQPPSGMVNTLFRHVGGS